MRSDDAQNFSFILPVGSEQSCGLEDLSLLEHANKSGYLQSAHSSLRGAAC
jgi:hypothetical protein